MSDRLKKHETIGCCGIDCGLCPRFYIKGDSACPGCGGLNFCKKHPSCGFLTCCAIKKRLEVCSDCHDYPCKRFDPEKEGYDSFVSHKMIFKNLDFIQRNGIERFLANQKVRMDILNDLLTNFDDGRSKSFYCISCTLLPLDTLKDIMAFAHDLDKKLDVKEKSTLIKNTLTQMAGSQKIDLKLRKPGTPADGVH